MLVTQDYMQLLQGGGKLPSVEDIDETIQQQLSQLALLRQLRNAHIPILRLPTEILGMILLHACPSRPARRSWDKPLAALVRLVQVCSRWRAIALSVPQLWSSITSFARKQMPLLLERSRQAPLFVYLDPAHRFFSALNKEAEAVYLQEQLESMEALGHLVRIRELELGAGHSEKWSDQALEQLQFFLSMPAPILVDLALEDIRNFQGRLLDNSAPHLRSLRLRSVDVDLQGWLPLRHLHVLDLRKTRNTPSVSQILHVLREAHLLRTLSVFIDLSKNTSLPEPLSEAVRIPALHTLHLEGSCRSLTVFLQNVITPALLKLSIKSRAVEDDDSNADVQRMLESDAVVIYLSRWSGVLGSPSITNDVVGHTSTLNASASSKARERPKLEIEILTRHTGASSQHVLEASVGALSLVHGKSLVLTAPVTGWFSPRGWLNAFPPGASHALRVLYLTGPPALAFVLTLSPKRGTKGKALMVELVTDECMLPGLTKVTLCDIHLRTNIGKSLLMTHLKQGLQMRAAAYGVAQLELVLERCNGFTQDDVDKLQAIGATTAVTVVGGMPQSKNVTVPKGPFWA